MRAATIADQIRGMVMVRSRAGLRGFLSNPKLVDHLLRDLAQRTEIGIDQNISLAVEPFAFSQELSDSGQRFGLFQEWPMGLALDAVKDFFWRGPQTGNESMSFQAGEVAFVGWQAATGRNNRALSACQLL